MDKVSKTPRTDAHCKQIIDDALGLEYAATELQYWAEKLEEELAAQIEPCNDAKEMGHGCLRAVKAENELAEQKEQYRVLTDEMLVMMDERNAAVLDAKENMEIANEFKKLMEQYRQHAEAAYKQSNIDAERYRWLRLQNWDCSPLAVVTKPIEAIKLGYDCPSRDRLDALIDDCIRVMK